MPRLPDKLQDDSWQLLLCCINRYCSFVDAQPRLNIPHAMHSDLMAPILPELRTALQCCELPGPSRWQVAGLVVGTEIQL